MQMVSREVWTTCVNCNLVSCTVVSEQLVYYFYAKKIINKTNGTGSFNIKQKDK